MTVQFNLGLDGCVPSERPVWGDAAKEDAAIGDEVSEVGVNTILEGRGDVRDCGRDSLIELCDALLVGLFPLGAGLFDCICGEGAKELVEGRAATCGANLGGEVRRGGDQHHAEPLRYDVLSGKAEQMGGIGVVDLDESALVCGIVLPRA